MAKVTMQHIADLAGVTRTTVSRVLHNPQQVALHTREHVERILAKQNYIYNAAAADFTKGRMSTIGLLLPTLGSHAFVATILATQEAVQSMNMFVTLGSTNYDPKTEAELLLQLQERRVAGIILVGFCPSNETLLRTIDKTGIPIVVIWEKPSLQGISFVGYDNKQAATQMVQHLIDLGHTRIGMLLGPWKQSSRVALRMTGYRQALENAGIAYDPSIVISSIPTFKHGVQGMRKIMLQQNPPTAIFAASDTLAIGAMDAAKALGMHIPEDISIAGFDGIDFGAYISPRLTSMKIPEKAMILQSCKYIKSRIDSGQTTIINRCLPTQMMVRESTNRLENH